jgi:hypothetical protein
MRHVAAGGVTLFTIAEEGPEATLVIGFGQNANCGELGLGVDQPKSATKPSRVSTLDDIDVFDIAAGQNTTFFLARPPKPGTAPETAAAEKWTDLPRFPAVVDVSEVCVVCREDREDDPALECDKVCVYIASLSPHKKKRGLKDHCSSARRRTILAVLTRLSAAFQTVRLACVISSGRF